MQYLQCSEVNIPGLLHLPISTMEHNKNQGVNRSVSQYTMYTQPKNNIEQISSFISLPFPTLFANAYVVSSEPVKKLFLIGQYSLSLFTKIMI